MKYESLLKTVIFIVIIIIISSFGIGDDFRQYTKEEIEKRDSIITVLEEQLNRMSDPIVLAENLVDRKYIWELTEQAERYFGTNINIKENVNPAISKNLYIPLLQLPDSIDHFLVTSAYRDNRHSLHSDSLAIDIRKNEAGDRFVNWLGTCEGDSWMVDNGLGMYLEYKYSSNIWNGIKNIPILRSYLKYNKHATKYHIHLYVKEEE